MQTVRAGQGTHRRSTQNPMWGAWDAGDLAGRDFTPPARPGLARAPRSLSPFIPQRAECLMGRRRPVTESAIFLTTNLTHTKHVGPPHGKIPCVKRPTRGYAAGLLSRWRGGANQSVARSYVRECTHCTMLLAGHETRTIVRVVGRSDPMTAGRLDRLSHVEVTLGEGLPALGYFPNVTAHAEILERCGDI